MTTDDRLERVLPDVLEHLAPSRAPDRLRDEILSSTSRMRPRPRWFVPPTHHPRFPTMTPTLRLGILGAVALATGLVAGPLFLFSGSPGPSPSPEPTPTAPPVDRLPAELTWWWIRSPMNLPDMGPDQDRAELDLTTDFMAKLVVGDDESDILGAGILKDTGLLRVTNNSFTANGCAKGTVGIYDWHVSDDGHRLTLDGTDDCAHRATYLNGEWRLYECPAGRIANPDGRPGETCRGSLAAGMHTSELFRAQAAGAPDMFTTSPGGLTVRVPEGWSNTGDFESGYILVPTSQYDPTRNIPMPASSGATDLTWPGIAVWARPVALEASISCRAIVATGIAGDAESLAGWLSTHDGLVVKDRLTVEVDGHQGIVLDLEVAPDWTGRCHEPGYSTNPTVPLFAYASAIQPDGAFLANTMWWSQGAERPQRIVLLDLAPGDTVFMQIEASDPAGQAAFVERAMPIVESMRFAP